MKPWLLEVNFSPSLNEDCEIDLQVKRVRLSVKCTRFCTHSAPSPLGSSSIAVDGRPGNPPSPRRAGRAPGDRRLGGRQPGPGRPDRKRGRSRPDGKESTSSAASAFAWETRLRRNVLQPRVAVLPPGRLRVGLGLAGAEGGRVRIAGRRRVPADLPIQRRDEGLVDATERAARAVAVRRQFTSSERAGTFAEVERGADPQPAENSLPRGFCEVKNPRQVSAGPKLTILVGETWAPAQQRGCRPQESSRKKMKVWFTSDAMKKPLSSMDFRIPHLSCSKSQNFKWIHRKPATRYPGLYYSEETMNLDRFLLSVCVRVGDKSPNVRRNSLYAYEIA
ncbi:MAG: hypothetical protein BJ554DRAFT_218 [Olpidium bornovanus]|uniref:Uncharacterized protein n=1 Tax=Olpidium bornovanus TaxID=278681 RepID=A0A8H8DIC5_9FUNG|nr:MAG: hypothetical protein BJ554DRAFT_218 [Olpidium bornovanus]